jgi:hypothetical protein
VRFARQWKQRTGSRSFKESTVSHLVFIAYNVVWWVPLVLVVTGLISYEAGFVLFTIITIIRLIADIIRNNLLTLERAVSFPFRIP